MSGIFWKWRGGGLRLKDGEASRAADRAGSVGTWTRRHSVLSALRRIDHFYCPHELLPPTSEPFPNAGHLASFRFQHLHNSAARHPARAASSQGRQMDHREAKPGHVSHQRRGYFSGTMSEKQTLVAAFEWK